MDNLWIFKALFLLTFMSTCNPTQESPRVRPKVPAGIEQDFQPYVADFMALTEEGYEEEALKKLHISFGDLKGSVAGECWSPDRGGNRIVLIDRDSWEMKSGNEREALMLHELGHCACFLKHTHFLGQYKNAKEEGKEQEHDGGFEKGYYEDGCPVTVMHPIVISERCYKKYRQSYRYELKLRCYGAKQSRK